MIMDGKISKFYKYENTSGRINIPSSIADILNWSHNDEVNMVLKNIDGQIGLFLFKKNE